MVDYFNFSGIREIQSLAQNQNVSVPQSRNIIGTLLFIVLAFKEIRIIFRIV